MASVWSLRLHPMGQCYESPFLLPCRLKSVGFALGFLRARAVMRTRKGRRRVEVPLAIARHLVVVSIWSPESSHQGCQMAMILHCALGWKQKGWRWLRTQCLHRIAFRRTWDISLLTCPGSSAATRTMLRLARPAAPAHRVVLTSPSGATADAICKIQQRMPRSRMASLLARHSAHRRSGRCASAASCCMSAPRLQSGSAPR
mmetsp:Transcript_122153/g.317395  ORF Transcript_122153/g.317395 Transcript_122153/m.317395 type:complete len:202 (-) Transcript_122153:1277-1882(-)